FPRSPRRGRPPRDQPPTTRPRTRRSGDAAWPAPASATAGSCIHLDRRGLVDAVAPVLPVPALAGKDAPVLLGGNRRLGLRVAQGNPRDAVVGHDVALLAV